MLVAPCSNLTRRFTVHCIEVLRELIAFDTWANRRILDSVQATPDNTKAQRLFAHVLAAQRLWLDRIARGELAVGEPWPEPDPASFEEQVATHHKQLVALIGVATEESLERPILYRNTKGAGFRTPMREILLHLMNHGTHHRAQVAQELRDSGAEVPALDFIAFVRERRGEGS
jgi:uncharacterized damage-inducible protein DinB